MNAWEIHHRRTALLNDLIVRLDAGDTLPAEPLPADLAAVFVDRDSLLLALQGVFARRVTARVDLALELHDIPGVSVAEAWQAVVDELPGVHRVLEEYADLPALARATANLHRAVALAAGIAAFDTPLPVAAEAGRAFVARAPRLVVPARRDGWLRERLSFRTLWKTA